MITFFFFSLIHAFSPVDLICFPNKNHVTIPRRFEPLSCSLTGLRASMTMSDFERKYSLGYRHMICLRKQKGLTVVMLHDAGYKVHLGIGQELPGELNWKNLFL